MNRFLPKLENWLSLLFSVRYHCCHCGSCTRGRWLSWSSLRYNLRHLWSASVSIPMEFANVDICQISSRDQAQKTSNAATLVGQTKETLEDRLSKVLEQADSNLRMLASWLWHTGEDWPNKDGPPLPAEFSDKEKYLPTQIFGNGAWLVRNDIDITKFQEGITTQLVRYLCSKLGVSMTLTWCA